MLKYYDEVVMYANHTTLTPDQEKALLDFVEGGNGLVAIHCASAMFTNSEKFISMVGGQLQKHGTGDFSAEIVQPEHPIMKGLQPFTTWDETYVHTKHNTVNHTVLMERVEASGRELRLATEITNPIPGCAHRARAASFTGRTGMTTGPGRSRNFRN